MATSEENDKCDGRFSIAGAEEADESDESTNGGRARVRESGLHFDRDAVVHFDANREE